MRVISFLALLAFVSAASPQPATTDPYSGVVVNNTVTFIGQEFYRTFVATWREQMGVERFSVVVLERPSARWGSLVSIEYEHREMFRAFLSPGRRDFVRQAGVDAAGLVYQRVVDVEVQRLLFRDPDMARDEI